MREIHQRVCRKHSFVSFYSSYHVNPGMYGRCDWCREISHNSKWAWQGTFRWVLCFISTPHQNDMLLAWHASSMTVCFPEVLWGFLLIPVELSPVTSWMLIITTAVKIQESKILFVTCHVTCRRNCINPTCCTYLHWLPAKGKKTHKTSLEARPKSKPNDKTNWKIVTWTGENVRGPVAWKSKKTSFSVTALWMTVKSISVLGMTLNCILQNKIMNECFRCLLETLTHAKH